MLFTLEIGRQNFKVFPKNEEFKKALKDFNKEFITYRKDRVRSKGRGRKSFFRTILVPDKLFVVQNVHLGFYIYPKTALDKFVKFISEIGIGRNMFEVIEHEKPKRFKVNIGMGVDMTPRPYQKKYIDVMSKKLHENTTFLVDLQTGKGKTFISASTIAKLGLRMAVLVKANFVKKWKKDLMKLYGLDDSDVFVVSGRDSLNHLIELGKRKETPKCVVFSAKTMQSYINSWEEMQFENCFNYGCFPDKLLDILRISVILVDEAHKEYHSIYKTVLSLDPTLLIGLSATLIHKDARINETYGYLYPDDKRLSFLKIDVYAKARSVLYKLDLPKKFRYMNGGYGYSQATFELSIISNRRLLYEFVSMILWGFDKYFWSIIKNNEKLSKKKCLLFFGSIEMCTIVTKVFKHYYGNEKIVSRYIGGDSYIDMLESDIIITTPGSAGEAIDIPNLIRVLSLVANDSIQQNLQMLGRLREDPDIIVEYVWFWCKNIPNHVTYDKNRKNLFMNRVKTIVDDVFPRNSVIPKDNLDTVLFK